MKYLGFAAAFASLLPLSATIFAQEETDIRQLKLKEWEPKSMLVTPVTLLDKPKYPAVDVHNHLGGGKQTLTPDRVEQYLREMNAAGVRTVVNLDGGWGDRLKETVEALDKAYPDRFLTFALIDFSGIDDENWTAREVARLEEGFAAGAKGLKFHKSLGLTVRYQNGELMKVDDPKLAPIFELCAKHKKPVMIHTADPAAFFTPLDRFNERWHELNEHPNWLFFGDKFPPREELLRQFTAVVEAHPQTTFIGAHFGNNVEDLATVGRWLDKYPNLYVDIDARISELGRQPYTAKKFFLKYQDRILFGTDTTPRKEAFRIYYRFLETEDEYFDCRDSHHLQGFWMIYGIQLPDEVLKKIYYANAERALGGEFVAAAEKGEADSSRPQYRVAKTADFEIDGTGQNENWKKASIAKLAGCGGREHPYASSFQLLYSDTGLYAFFQGEDKLLNASMQEDFADLWKEDCFEIFLRPDRKETTYFEYEISPLGKELAIQLTNINGQKQGWRPWHYEGERRVKKAVSVQGGKAESKAAIQSWTAEIFIPYELLKPLRNVPAKPNMVWDANIYRMDYDDGVRGWNWAPVGPSFHEYENFGQLIFE